MKRVKQIIHYWCDDITNRKYLGSGITVAVLDTGIAPHPDFRKKVAYFKDFVHGQEVIYDDNGHGTHVCGVVCGSGAVLNGEYAGMAPECNLIVLKVLDRKGNGNVNEVLAGFRWILENQKRYRIRIVNISVGMHAQSECKEEEKLINGVEMLWDAGIVVVAAAGNLGPGKGSITTPGVSKKIITVGSSNDQFYIDEKGRKRKDYSGRGPTKECVCKPDLVAPGSYITSCNADYVRNREKPYIMKSGTSMATPVVSGAIANLLSKYPDMTNVEVKLKIRESSSDLGLQQNQQGWGLLNVKKLLE